MKQIGENYSGWIREGFNLYKDHLGSLVLLSLVAAIISAVTLGILTGPMMAGFLMIVKKLSSDKDYKPEIRELFEGFNHFLHTFLLWLVISVAMLIVSAVLQIIPVLGPIVSFCLWLLAITFQMFATILIIEKNMEFQKAIGETYAIFKDEMGPSLGFFLITGLICNIGLILCGIGAILTFPIGFCIVTLAYRDLS